MRKLMIFTMVMCSAVYGESGSESTDSPASASPDADALAVEGSDASLAADPVHPPDSGAAPSASVHAAPDAPHASAAFQPEQPGAGATRGGLAAPILDEDSLNLSYQALLTSDGVPIGNPTVDLTFNIYTVGGALVEGPILVRLVPVRNGIVDTVFPVTASSFDGSGRELGVRIDAGPELSPRAPLVTVPYALRVDRVASAELDDNIDLGDAENAGQLNIYRTGGATPTIQATGSNSQISTYGIDGEEQIRLWGGSWGEIYLHDSSESNDRTVVLSATAESGGELSLRDTDAGASVFLDGGDGTVSAEQRIKLMNTIGGTEYASLGRNGSGGGVLRTYDENGDQTLIAGSTGTGGGAFANYHLGSSIWAGVTVDGDDGNSGNIAVKRPNNQTTIELDASEAGSDGAQISLADASGSNTIILDAEEGAGSVLRMYDSAGTQTVVVDGEGAGGGAGVTLFNSAGNSTLSIDGDESDHGEIFVLDATGNNAVIIQAFEASAGGAQILLRNAAASTTVEIDADWGGSGEGRVRTSVLEITGGADLAEQFDVRGPVKPGMVVSLDPEHIGDLVVASREYDRKVAGIVSGANGVKPGMLMGQYDSLANGKHAVALTGRVFCRAVQASGDPIEVGDLLTTSSVPGHCMKVTDHARAQGAIIGKAMSPVRDGLVLVLVNLQ